MIALYTIALPDAGPVKPDTRRSLRILQYYCNYKEARAFGWFTLYQILTFVRGGVDYSNKEA